MRRSQIPQQSALQLLGFSFSPVPRRDHFVESCVKRPSLYSRGSKHMTANSFASEALSPAPSYVSLQVMLLPRSKTAVVAIMLRLGKLKFPVVGPAAIAALFTLLIYTPELTMVWLPAVTAAVVCGYFLSRFSVRRLAPADLRGAELRVSDSGITALRVAPYFAPQFIGILPEFATISFAALLVATLCAQRVGMIFAEEVASTLVPAMVLSTICAVLAGRQMLCWRINEFVLRARQHAAWINMLGARSLVLLCIVLWQLPFSSIPGLTQRIPKVQYVSDYVPRMRAVKRSLSPSGNVSVEVRAGDGGKHELWARDRHNLKKTSLIAIYDPEITALVSHDDRWIAVTYPDIGGKYVHLFERAPAEGVASPQYVRRETEWPGLASKVRTAYEEITKDAARFRKGRWSVSASEWSKESGKLSMILTFEGLPAEFQVEPWRCNYTPEVGRVDSVSSMQIMDRSTQRREVVKFVQEVTRFDERRSLSELIACYHDTIAYYDKPAPVDRAYIEKEKKAIFEDWPFAKLDITGAIEPTNGPIKESWLVTVPTRFVARNSAKGLISEGEERTEYVVSFFNGFPKIVGERGVVLRSAKRREGADSVQPSSAGPDSFPGERHPETRTRLLSERDVTDWSLEKLRYAINEMFARHGGEFGKPEIDSVFRRFNWQAVRRGVSLETIEREHFSDVEQRNLKLLGALRDQKKAPR